MAQYLGVDASTPTRSSVFERLSIAQGQYSHKMSAEAEIVELRRQVGVQDAKLVLPPMIQIDASDRFTVDQSKAFDEFEKRFIVAKFAENLDIAAEIAARIGVPLVGIYHAKVEQAASNPAMSRLAITALEDDAEEFEAKVKATKKQDDKVVFAKIADRVMAMLPTPTEEDLKDKGEAIHTAEEWRTIEESKKRVRDMQSAGNASSDAYVSEKLSVSGRLVLDDDRSSDDDFELIIDEEAPSIATPKDARRPSVGGVEQEVITLDTL